eukprot:202097-Hanusia_phi.AAC.1
MVCARIRHFLQGRWVFLFQVEDKVSFEDNPEGRAGSGHSRQSANPQSQGRAPARREASVAREPHQPGGGGQRRILNALEHYQNHDLRKARQALTGLGHSQESFSAIHQQTLEKFPTRDEILPHASISSAVEQAREMLNSVVDIQVDEPLTSLDKILSERNIEQAVRRFTASAAQDQFGWRPFQHLRSVLRLGESHRIKYIDYHEKRSSMTSHFTP